MKITYHMSTLLWTLLYVGTALAGGVITNLLINPNFNMSWYEAFAAFCGIIAIVTLFAMIVIPIVHYLIWLRYKHIHAQVAKYLDSLK